MAKSKYNENGECCGTCNCKLKEVPAPNVECVELDKANNQLQELTDYFTREKSVDVLLSKDLLLEYIRSFRSSLGE